MKKIGFVDLYLDEWHANNYPAWINAVDGDCSVAYAWAEEETSRVTGVSTDEWCSRMGIERVNTIEELCEKSDYIVVLAPSNPEKHLEYASKVLSYGKPTYIDKTFAPDAETAEAIYELGQKYSTPFFSTSALRYATELNDLKGIKDMIITGGGSNFPEYVVHTAEMAQILLDEPFCEVSVQAVGIQRIATVKTENNQAVIIFSPALPFAVYGTLGTKNYAATVRSDFFKLLIADMVRFFETGVAPVTKEQTMSVMKLRDAILKCE